MKTHQLEVYSFSIPEVVNFLKNEDVEIGDSLSVNVNKEMTNAIVGLMLIIGLAIYYYLDVTKKVRKKEGEQILNDLMQKTTAKEIENLIESEYGIKIEMEEKIDSEQNFWTKVSTQAFVRAYDSDEPDYSDVPLMEPNPNYNAWKKDQ